jgi:hypothetical protein
VRQWRQARIGIETVGGGIVWPSRQPIATRVQKDGTFSVTAREKTSDARLTSAARDRPDPDGAEK